MNGAGRGRVPAIVVSLALAGCAATPAGGPASTSETAAEPVAARWEPHILNFVQTPLSCTGGRNCESRRKEVTFILEHLGARDVEVTTEQARFSRLVPIAGGAPAVADSVPVTARWEEVRFRRQENDRYDDGVEYFLLHIRHSVLPSFTTRKVREQRTQLAVEVLRPVAD